MSKPILYDYKYFLHHMELAHNHPPVQELLHARFSKSD